MSEKTTIANAIAMQLPMTRIKIFLAGVFYRFVRTVYRSDRRIIVRKGITYQVDLSEGIELSLFLFGGFQPYVTRNRFISLAPDAVVLDIGANVGSMALGFAQNTPAGRVYAFEATQYAFQKLLTNLKLNGALAERIVPVNKIVAEHSGEGHQMTTYASWKVDGRLNPTRHRLHGGSPTTAVMQTVSVDDFCRSENLKRVDLIKIDTDGHEFTILKGARETLKKFQPAVVFEIGGYVMKEKKLAFEDYYNFLSGFGYKLVNAKNDKTVDLTNYKNHIPMRATTDLIATPSIK